MSERCRHLHRVAFLASERHRPAEIVEGSDRVSSPETHPSTNGTDAPFVRVWRACLTLGDERVSGMERSIPASLHVVEPDQIRSHEPHACAVSKRSPSRIASA